MSYHLSSLGQLSTGVVIDRAPSARPLPPWATEMLAGYLLSSGLPGCRINSTSRTPEEQASAMFDNESTGRHIEYGAPGRAVIDLYWNMQGSAPQDIKAAMAAKIREFTDRGVVVSYHCEGPPQYAAADIDPSSVGGVGSASYEVFLGTLRAARNAGQLAELMSPDVGVGNLGYDPAIHVVFVETAAARWEAAVENAASGGRASMFQGESAPAGIPLWAWFGGAAITAWFLWRGRRR